MIGSIPYVKDYLDHEHPQPGNPNGIFLSGNRKSLGRALGIRAIETIYRQSRRLFPKLLESPNVLPEDKPKIKELLKKPWNPYILRHSSLTDKSKILKEHVLRQHAGWSISSNMPQKYIHYFGNESNESLLEAYGLMPRRQQNRINWGAICRNPIVDSFISEPCGTLTSPDGFTLTSEGERVLRCIGGGAVVTLLAPEVLASIRSLGPAVGCGASPGGQTSGSNPLLQIIMLWVLFLVVYFPSSD